MANRVQENAAPFLQKYIKVPFLFGFGWLILIDQFSGRSALCQGTRWRERGKPQKVSSKLGGKGRTMRLLLLPTAFLIERHFESLTRSGILNQERECNLQLDYGRH